MDSEVEKLLKRKYETAKKNNDYQTMAMIEDRDIDLINEQKYYITHRVGFNKKLQEHMQGIYERFENEAKPLKEKDSEVFLLVEIEEEKDEKYLNCPPEIQKHVKIILSSSNKEIVDKEYDKWQNYLEYREKKLKEDYGKDHKLINKPKYKIIKYSDLVYEYENLLAKQL